MNKYIVFVRYTARSDDKHRRFTVSASSPEEAQKKAVDYVISLAAMPANRISKQSIKVLGVEPATGDADGAPISEGKNMNRKNFRSIVKECLAEVRKELDPRHQLKESLRGVVQEVLTEIANINSPEPDKDEVEKVQKGYDKKGNERTDKSNNKLRDELETIVHDIDPTWNVYWDDHNQLVVRAQNLLYVRIAPKFENNYDIDAMVKLVDRVRAIALTWDQVKDFIKVNFKALKGRTIPDQLHQKSIDNHEDREVIKKMAGPEHDIVKNRLGDKKNGEGAKIKDTKNKWMDYNEPQTKRPEDMPDQPMKRVTEPGKDPEGKNHKIEKTDKVKPQKHDKSPTDLRPNDKKTTKFRPKKA